MQRFQRLRIAWGVVGAAIILLVLATVAVAQGPDEKVRSLASRWLLLNDDVGEEGILEKTLRENRIELQPLFLDALEKGPDDTLLSEVEKAADNRFEQNQKLLTANEGSGLSPEDLEIARNMTREQFIEQEKQSFILRYKSQAIAGLGIVGDEKAREVLKAIASDAQSPLRSSAEQALQKLSH